MTRAKVKELTLIHGWYNDNYNDFYTLQLATALYQFMLSQLGGLVGTQSLSHLDWMMV